MYCTLQSVSTEEKFEKVPIVKHNGYDLQTFLSIHDHGHVFILPSYLQAACVTHIKWNCSMI